MQRKARERISDRMSGATWEALARQDPWHAVLTDVDSRVAAGDPEARAAFYRSGEEYLERIVEAIRAHFGPLERFDVAADFGCGVGRVAVPLAGRCRELTAVDVSPTMLSMTAAYAREKELANLTVQPLAEFIADDCPLDLLHSVLVLQHIWPEEGFRILEAIIPRVRAGGMVVLHLPYFVGAKRARPLFRWARSRVPGFNAVANVLRGKPAKTPYMQMNAYDLNRLTGLLHRVGFGDLVLLRESQREVQGVIVVGRRGAGSSG